MIIEHDVTIRHEQYNVNEIEVLYKGEYVKFVRERTCEYLGDEISGGCSVCHGWLDPACAYCPSCGAKVNR